MRLSHICLKVWQSCLVEAYSHFRSTFQQCQVLKPTYPVQLNAPTNLPLLVWLQCHATQSNLVFTVLVQSLCLNFCFYWRQVTTQSSFLRHFKLFKDPTNILVYLIPFQLWQPCISREFSYFRPSFQWGILALDFIR